MEQAYHITEVPDVGVPMRVVPYNEPVEPPAPPTPLPDWLSLTPKPEEQTRLVKFPRSKAELEYEQSLFEAIFEPILDEMVIGNGIEKEQFNGW